MQQWCDALAPRVSLSSSSKLHRCTSTVGESKCFCWAPDEISGSVCVSSVCSSAESATQQELCAQIHLYQTDMIWFCIIKRVSSRWAGACLGARGSLALLFTVENERCEILMCFCHLNGLFSNAEYGHGWAAVFDCIKYWPVSRHDISAMFAEVLEASQLQTLEALDWTIL